MGYESLNLDVRSFFMARLRLLGFLLMMARFTTLVFYVHMARLSLLSD